jgi:hypothetical protein
VERKSLPNIEYKGITIVPDSCQMFTNEGNKRVVTIIKKCITKVQTGTTGPKIEAYAIGLLEDLSKKSKYAECLDTEPRGTVENYIQIAAEKNGIRFQNIWL